jgi:hypothetical protein
MEDKPETSAGEGSSARQEDIDGKRRELAVSVSAPTAGWIGLHVAPLDEAVAIVCTYLDDPFPEMIAWLEKIATGDNEAIWTIDEEGATVRLIWLESRGWGDRCEHLLFCRTWWEDLTTAGLRVTRRDVVEKFYRAFRAMAERDDYDPDQWEDNGSELPALRSDVIESYLAEADGDEAIGRGASSQ